MHPPACFLFWPLSLTPITLLCIYSGPTDARTRARARAHTHTHSSHRRNAEPQNRNRTVAHTYVK